MSTTTDDGANLALPIRRRPGLGRRWGAYFLAVICAVVAVAALSLTGWGSGVNPWAQTVRDLPLLITMVAAGVLAGAAIVGAHSFRRGPLLLGALVGLVPAVLRVGANFTSLY